MTYLLYDHRKGALHYSEVDLILEKLYLRPLRRSIHFCFYIVLSMMHAWSHSMSWAKQSLKEPNGVTSWYSVFTNTYFSCNVSYLATSRHLGFSVSYHLPLNNAFLSPSTQHRKLVKATLHFCLKHVKYEMKVVIEIQNSTRCQRVDIA